LFRSFVLSLCAAASLYAADPPAENLIFVMSDGVRWQEVFNGADAALMTKEYGFSTAAAPARREQLMPFLWSEIARRGQIWGNPSVGSEAWVTNGLNFSYPGYNETLTGAPDPRVKSNDKIPNQNVTVLEWLNSRPRFRGKVAAFGSWDVFPYIFNAARAGFLVNAGYDPLTVAPVTPTLALLNRVKAETRVWPDEAYDAFLFHTAIEYVKLHRPRVLFLGLGDTDEWAHAGRYDLYLDSVRRADAYVKELWDTVQSIPQYRGKTALVFTPDHGRGKGPEWKSHGEKIPDSKYIWLSFLGPGVAPTGERKNVAGVTQSQVAATLASLLGEDFNAATPKAAKPIPLK
jgi:hypothetical protein